MEEKISIAPMMEWTHAHYRALMRGLTRKTILYTEMVVDSTIMHQQNNLDFYIGSRVFEDPSVMQLGGNNPEELARAVEIVDGYGDYAEFNLNCGCPSNKVSKRCFGAKLMLVPDTVREIVHQMQRRTTKPVTVKCRLGVDDRDSYEELTHFIRTAASGGPRKFIIHARKCLLDGLTTKQNREIPPLHYETVHKLQRDFPELSFVINGGIQNFDEAESHMSDIWTWKKEYGGEDEVLPGLQGAMLGRQAYHNPLMFANADSRFFGCKDPGLTRRELIERYMDYCDWIQSDDGPRCITLKNVGKGKAPKMASTNVLTQTIHNIFTGCEGCAKFRAVMNDTYTSAVRKYNPTAREVLETGMEVFNDEVLDDVNYSTGRGKVEGSEGSVGDKVIESNKPLRLDQDSEAYRWKNEFKDRNRRPCERFRRPDDVVTIYSENADFSICMPPEKRSRAESKNGYFEE